MRADVPLTFFSVADFPGRVLPKTDAGKVRVLLALTLTLSPGERGQPARVFVFSVDRPANPGTPHSKNAADVSPSPGGEGRDEGGCSTNFFSVADFPGRVLPKADAGKVRLLLAPGDSQRTFSFYWLTVQPIPPHDIPKTRRTFLPLLGGAGRGEGERQTIPSRNSSQPLHVPEKSATSWTAEAIPQSGSNTAFARTKILRRQFRSHPPESVVAAPAFASLRRGRPALPAHSMTLCYSFPVAGKSERSLLGKYELSRSCTTAEGF